MLRGKVRGDCECSEGCQNCYAWVLRNRNASQAAEHTTWSAAKLRELSRARFDGAHKRGQNARPMVFVCDMGDLFHALVPDDAIMGALATFTARPEVDWQILTKRPSRMVELWGGARLPHNVWVGVTAENQRRADERTPFLARLPAAVRFVSVEPMLEPMTLDLGGVNWVICGGESGKERRPFSHDWARAIRRQCEQAGVPFFFKQGSAFAPGRDCLMDGRELKQWPTTPCARLTSTTTDALQGDAGLPATGDGARNVGQPFTPFRAGSGDGWHAIEPPEWASEVLEGVTRRWYADGDRLESVT